MMGDQAWVDEKRRNRMATIDAMPHEIRALINDYGFHVVNTLMQSGVKKPNQIRNVVEVILDEFSPSRGSYSSQGVRVALLDPALSPSQPQGGD